MNTPKEMVEAFVDDVVTELNFLAELWEDEAETLRGWGCDKQAHVLERCAEQLLAELSGDA